MVKIPSCIAEIRAISKEKFSKFHAIDRIEQRVERGVMPPHEFVDTWTKLNFKGTDQVVQQYIESHEEAKEIPASDWDIIAYIGYPVRRIGHFLTRMTTTQEPLNLAMLYVAHATAYKMMYEIEESRDGHPGYICGLMNRADSNGVYGIWGHDLCDLVYNGLTIINVVPPSCTVPRWTAIVELGVDS